MVKCQICGKEYKTVTPSHLKRAHGLTMAEYRERFPDAPIRRPVTDEMRANYSRAAYKRWADPDFWAANAPLLAEMSAEANAALQEKLKDPEFYAEFCRACGGDGIRKPAKPPRKKRKPTTCLDCGKEISRHAKRCQECYFAHLREQALHKCKNPKCSEKTTNVYCSDKCKRSDPAWLEAKRRAGRISQEKHPGCRENLNHRSFGMLGKHHSKESRLLMSAQKRKYWAERSSNTGYYPPFWYELADIIRERDKHRCQVCSETESSSLHDVHHIDHNRSNNHPSNLICLCRSCHMKAQHDPNTWQPRLKSITHPKQIPNSYWDLPSTTLPSTT